MLLIDASVWVSLVERDNPHRAAAMRLIGDRPQTLSALDLTLYEVANAIGVKQGDTPQAIQVNRLLLKCCRHRVHTADPELIDQTMQVAAEHGLTAYDAAYVATARRHGLTLVSLDVRDLVSKGLAVVPDEGLYP